MYEELGVSSIIVAGSSGAYFHVADTVIQMKEYVPVDITKKAKQAAADYPGEAKQEGFPDFCAVRKPRANEALKRDDRIKIKAMGTSELSLSKESVELRYLEQLEDQEQSMALAYILKYSQLKLMDGRKDLKQIGELLENQLDQNGLESLLSGERFCRNWQDPENRKSWLVSIGIEGWKCSKAEKIEYM